MGPRRGWVIPFVGRRTADGIELVGYLAAGFVLLGLIATALIPKSAAREGNPTPAPVAYV